MIVHNKTEARRNHDKNIGRMWAAGSVYSPTKLSPDRAINVIKNMDYRAYNDAASLTEKYLILCSPTP
jgi:hypothetical protein